MRVIERDVSRERVDELVLSRHERVGERLVRQIRVLFGHDLRPSKFFDLWRGYKRERIKRSFDLTVVGKICPTEERGNCGRCLGCCFSLQ
jgi:hypothetical protein